MALCARPRNHRCISGLDVCYAAASSGTGSVDFYNCVFEQRRNSAKVAFDRMGLIRNGLVARRQKCDFQPRHLIFRQQYALGFERYFRNFLHYLHNFRLVLIFLSNSVDGSLISCIVGCNPTIRRRLLHLPILSL